MSQQRNYPPLSPIILPIPASPLKRQLGISADGQAISPITLSRSTSAMSDEDIVDKGIQQTLKAYKFTLKGRYKQMQEERDALLLKYISPENTPSEQHLYNTLWESLRLRMHALNQKIETIKYLLEQF